MTAPLGQYDSSKLLNIGTNRWSVKPELGFSIEFDGGAGGAQCGAAGPWGLIHFLDGLRLRPRDGGKRFLIDVQLGAAQARERKQDHESGTLRALCLVNTTTSLSGAVGNHIEEVLARGNLPQANGAVVRPRQGVPAGPVQGGVGG